MIFSDPKTARTINRLRVLNCIHQSETISRAGLSRELVINKVSISEIVEGLLSEGLIEEAGKVSGAVGRQPTLLRICKQAYYVLCLDIGLKNTVLGICNMTGDLVRFERSPTPDFLDPEDLADFIFEAAQKLTGRFRSPERILGCAVTIHASIDTEKGVLLSAPDWGWGNINLVKLMRNRFLLPVIIDSNVRSMLLAERWFGNINLEKSVFYINWGQKIGTAHMSGNSILSVNSEFGHTPVSKQSTCFCGKSGCLEASAGGWSLQEQGNTILGTFDETVRQLYIRSEKHPGLTALFTDAAVSMGQAAATAANIINPGTIIIGGGLAAVEDLYFRIINETFSLFAAPRTRSSLLIVRSSLGDRAGILGAASLGLNAFMYKRTQLDTLAAADSTF
ncbi:MAG: ROK family transcriptional regulator [Spirochaetales bacterium]|nr:ROK family transcriptional regulator [Spirochaetales bacterium]